MRSILILLLVTATAGAQTVHDEMIVSTEWLARHMNYATVVDVTDTRSFDVAHIPNARLLEYSRLVTTRHRIPNELPEVDVLEDIIGKSGIGDRGRIILYGRDPLQVARAWFTFDYLGQGHRTSILDGGFEKWTSEGHPVEKGNPGCEAATFRARPRPSAVVRMSVLRDMVKWRTVLGRSYVLIDARSPAQFAGQEMSADIERPGRIPGSVNVPWTENFTTGAIQRFLPARELREAYLIAGVSTKSANIVYCRTGVQAAADYFVLRYLGYDAALYDGSFIEWSTSPENLVVEVQDDGFQKSK
jgi:thiosulfate/3-mercaptopyruvate sulfurtransferase